MRRGIGVEPPLPFPLEVEGDKVEGSGTLLFQSILPMERIDLPPTTQPLQTSVLARNGMRSACFFTVSILFTTRSVGRSALPPGSLKSEPSSLSTRT